VSGSWLVCWVVSQCTINIWQHVVRRSRHNAAVSRVSGGGLAGGGRGGGGGGSQDVFTKSGSTSCGAAGTTQR
jgi:hypothetical protein